MFVPSSYFQHAFYLDSVKRKNCVAFRVRSPPCVWLWEGGPGRKTPSRKATDGQVCVFLFSPSALYSVYKTNHETPELTQNVSDKRSDGFKLFLHGNKVRKLRGENGEPSWVRVGWGGWIWPSWESCPAASRLVSMLRHFAISDK